MSCYSMEVLDSNGVDWSLWTANSYVSELLNNQIVVK